MRRLERLAAVLLRRGEGLLLGALGPSLLLLFRACGGGVDPSVAFGGGSTSLCRLRADLITLPALLPISMPSQSPSGVVVAAAAEEEVTAAVH